MKAGNDNQDKLAWCEAGAEKEAEFCRNVLPRYGLRGWINPEKEYNPYAPDLVVNDLLAELKYRNTPFYKSELVCTPPIPNGRCVTLNLKDVTRYRHKYPLLWIYFWVEWEASSQEIMGDVFEAPACNGVWCIRFDDLEMILRRHQPQPITYQQRKEDVDGNARQSYPIDLDWLIRLEKGVHYFPPGGVISYCFKHGTFQGDGNCPGCERERLA